MGQRDDAIRVVVLALFERLRDPMRPATRRPDAAVYLFVGVKPLVVMIQGTPNSRESV